MITAVRWNAI